MFSFFAVEEIVEKLLKELTERKLWPFSDEPCMEKFLPFSELTIEKLKVWLAILEFAALMARVSRLKLHDLVSNKI